MTSKENVMLGVDGSLTDLHMHPDMYWQPKWDGYRGKLVFQNGHISIFNRNGSDEWTPRLPDVTEGLQQFAQATGASRFALDAELVVFQDGHSSLSAIASRCKTQNLQMIQLKLRRLYPVDAMLFDIIEWDDQRLESDPLMNRHNLLTSIYSTYVKAIAGQPKRIQLTPNYLDVDVAWNEWVIKRHEEGLMAKDPMSPYTYARCPSWIKVKIRDSDTFHVVGYTAGDGNRTDTFGALILADDAGVCRGRCGGGFSWAAPDSTARQILQALKQAPVINPPFSEAEVGLPYTPVDTKMQVKVAFLKTFNGSSKLRSPQLIDWWIPQ